MRSEHYVLSFYARVEMKGLSKAQKPLKTPDHLMNAFSISLLLASEGIKIPIPFRQRGPKRGIMLGINSYT